MQLRDPRASAAVDGRPDSYVDVTGNLVAIADDGTFEHAAIDEQWARAYAERQGVAYETVVVDATTEKSDAELVEAGICPFCDDYEGTGVPQHASAAHPDKWADYKAD